MDRRLHLASHREDECRRIARILEIIQLISIAPRQWKRSTLASHYEIGERMIQKDLYLIRYKLGLHLEHDSQGYFFEELPHLPTTAYSFAEALALLMAAHAAQALPGVNSAELAAAIARLEAIFPDELRPLLHKASDQLPRRAAQPHRQEILTLLYRALVEHKQVCISYATVSRLTEAVLPANGTLPRVVEPYHLLPYGRSWHLIAYDHRRKEVLEFKVDRIQSAELLDTAYSIPLDFDVDVYLGDSWGLMRGSARTPEKVILLFDVQAGRWVAEERWHKSQQSELLPDGRVRMTFFVGVTPEMVNWLLYYGERVYVEWPEWLRGEVREAHRRATVHNI